MVINKMKCLRMLPLWAGHKPKVLKALMLLRKKELECQIGFHIQLFALFTQSRLVKTEILKGKQFPIESWQRVVTQSLGGENNILHEQYVTFPFK